jgi:hypothetical protein
MEQTFITVYIKMLNGEILQLDNIPSTTRDLRDLRAKINDIDPVAFPSTHLYLTRMEPHEFKQPFRHEETFLLVVGGCYRCERLCSKPTSVYHGITVVDHVGGDDGRAFEAMRQDGHFHFEGHFQTCEEQLRARRATDLTGTLYVGDTVLVHSYGNVTQIRVRPGIFVSVAAHFVFRYVGGDEWQRYLFMVEEPGYISHDYTAESDFLDAICHDMRSKEEEEDQDHDQDE